MNALILISMMGVYIIPPELVFITLRGTFINRKVYYSRSDGVKGAAFCSENQARPLV